MSSGPIIRDSGPIIDRGDGVPIVLVPGLQGRWEYLRATVDALARSHRVITFSLGDEPAWGQPFGHERGLENFADQVDHVLDDRGLTDAVICGVSFGGLVALRFAATRPRRTSALVLTSTPGPHWHLSDRHRQYVQRPWLFAPLFFAGSPGRLYPEVMAALPDLRARGRFAVRQTWTALRAPVSAARMAARARIIDPVNNAADCAALTVPTLIVTGEDGLDHVVSAHGTHEYVSIIRGARAVTLERTGHWGCVTRADAFTDVIDRFLSASQAHGSDYAA